MLLAERARERAAAGVCALGLVLTGFGTGRDLLDVLEAQPDRKELQRQFFGRKAESLPEEQMLLAAINPPMWLTSAIVSAPTSSAILLNAA